MKANAVMSTYLVNAIISINLSTTFAITLVKQQWSKFISSWIASHVTKSYSKISGIISHRDYATRGRRAGTRGLPGTDSESAATTATVSAAGRRRRSPGLRVSLSHSGSGRPQARRTRSCLHHCARGREAVASVARGRRGSAGDEAPGRRPLSLARGCQSR